MRKSVKYAAGAAVSAGVIIAAAGCTQPSSSAPAASVTNPVKSYGWQVGDKPVSQAPAAPSPAAVTHVPAPAKPAAPAMTPSQHSAVQDAQDYLASEPGFSFSGLVKQLEFDKFSPADATWAISHITVNWDQQAAADAKNYQDSQGGFSFGSMVDQLTFDGFTAGQAAYGAHAVGL